MIPVLEFARTKDGLEMRAGQEIHDQLKAQLPEGSSCVDDCPFCKIPETASEGEGQVSDKVYTQEALDALLADARTKASADATTELTQKVAQLEADLQAKTEELAQAQSNLDVVNAAKAALETQIAEKEQAETLATLGDERVAKVKEVVDLSDEILAERKAGWAAMSEEAFDQTLKDMEAAVQVAKGESKPPKSNKVDPTRETAGKDDTDTASIRKFFGDLASV